MPRSLAISCQWVKALFGAGEELLFVWTRRGLQGDLEVAAKWAGYEVTNVTTARQGRCNLHTLVLWWLRVELFRIQTEYVRTNVHFK